MCHNNLEWVLISYLEEELKMRANQKSTCNIHYFFTTFLMFVSYIYIYVYVYLWQFKDITCFKTTLQHRREHHFIIR